MDLALHFIIHSKREPGPDEERIIELSSLTARGKAPDYLDSVGNISFNLENWSKLRIDTPR